MREIGDNEKNTILTFVNDYQKKFDYYEMASKLAAILIDNELQKNAIRAIVTHRAKNPLRLNDKILKRAMSSEVPYTSSEAIFADINDLAGVRVSLYFFGDMNRAKSIILECFNIDEKGIKNFPRHDQDRHNDTQSNTDFKKRFLGYKATHFQAKLKQEQLSNANSRYSDAFVEIQVTSLLMHAWAEVEHDLVYKPYQGQLTENELSLLDQLNGIVLCGEYSLESLQESMNQRIKNSKGSFSDHYSLASYIFSKYKTKESSKLNMGDFELLFRFLNKAKMNDSKQVDNHIKLVDKTQTSLDVSKQIIDSIISSDIELFNIYQSMINDKNTDNQSLNIKEFLQLWNRIEELFSRVDINGEKSLSKLHTQRYRRIILGDYYNSYLRIRSVRNNLVHGIEQYEQDFLDSLTESMHKIISHLQMNI